nr:site-specific integrase [Ferrimonas balearica]
MVGRPSGLTKAVQHTDGGGLVLEQSPKGKLTWLYRYRINGKPQRVKLGSYLQRSQGQELLGHMCMATARQMRDQCRLWLDQGKDPRVELALKKQAHIRPVTLKDALLYWYENYAVKHRTNHVKNLAQLEKWILPEIGMLPLERLETHHWLPIFDEMSAAYPVAAANVLQMCKQALKYCSLRQFAVNNSLSNLTPSDVSKGAESRDRVLSDRELADLWCCVNRQKLPDYYQEILRLAVVFGCRTGELRRSRWTEWDLEGRTWTIKETSKAGNRVVRPIPERVLPWLRQLNSQFGSTGYLLGQLKQDATVSQYCRLLWKHFDHREPWTAHDIRRTVVTRLNELGVAPYVVEKLVGHTMGRVMAVYNKAHYVAEQEQALNLWLDHLELIRDRYLK